VATEGPVDADTTGDEPPGRRGAIAARLAAGNPSRLLYGAVVSAAVLAVVDMHTETWSQVLLAIAIVLIVYWLAHVYVETLADRLLSATHRPRFRRVSHHEAPILLGGVPAMLVVAAASLLGAPVSTATSIAQWVTVALLAGAGYLGGHRAGRTGWSLFVDVLIAVLFGVLTVLLKVLLH
jgi:hypothetical protein